MHSCFCLLVFFSVAFVFVNQLSCAALPGLTAQEKQWLQKGFREDKAGWIYVSLNGEPMERGFQYGYLTANEYKDALRVFTALTYQTTGMTLDFFNEAAVKLHKDKIPEELMQEIQGIAQGFTKGGVPTTVDDVIGWNDNTEITGYWWPTVQSQYGSISKPANRFVKGHCSSFVATGNATADGKVVLGHETFTEFWNGQYNNIMVELNPTKGYKMKFQSAAPGLVASMTDFWLNSAGLAISETTIVGYSGYNTSAYPEWVRARVATQYASTIDEWVSIMNNGNNGGYANSWLLGDIYTGEIGRFEEGLIYQSYSKKKDGYFYGDNAPQDPRIRNLECNDVGYSDVRQQTGARRTRWPQVLNENYGKIDLEIGKKLLADTYDVYLEKINPSSRTICSHYDVDPQYYASDPNAVWNVPFTPAGSVDGKVVDWSIGKTMNVSAIFGRADGVAFDADSFLKAHPQWAWQAGYLQSRPSQPYAIF